MFWQVPVDEKASKLLAFSTLEGIFEPTRLPQGCLNAAYWAQRCVQRALQEDGLLGHISSGCGVASWIDDILLWASSDEELAGLVEKVF